MRVLCNQNVQFMHKMFECELFNLVVVQVGTLIVVVMGRYVRSWDLNSWDAHGTTFMGRSWDVHGTHMGLPLLPLLPIIPRIQVSYRGLDKNTATLAMYCM